MKAVRYLLGKIRRYDPAMIGIMALFSVLAAAYPFIWVVVPSRILALYEAGQPWGLVPLLLAGGALAVVCAFATTFLRGNYRMRMNKVRYHLIRDLMDYSLSMPFENTLHESALNDIQLANDSVRNPTMGAGGIVLTLLKVMGEVLAGIGFLGLLSRMSWWVIGLIVVIVAATFVLNERRARLEDEVWERYSPFDRKKGVLTQYVFDPAARKDNMLYHLHGLIRAYYQRFVESGVQVIRAMARRRMGVDALIALLNLLRDVLLYGFLIRQFLRGQIGVADFYLYMTGVLAFVVIAQDAMSDIAVIRKEGKRFAHFMRLDMDKPAPSTVSAAPQEAQVLAAEGLCFRYPGSERDVINDLSLTIRPGEKIALVGENGSGKTTLMLLLCRLYRPTAGRITWGGEDIWALPQERWRDMISVVFQDAMLLPFSLADNVAMDEQPDAGQLADAMARSGLNEVADALPHGQQTSLLRILDDEGVDLSGGQRQRLYLARALYKPDTRLLILDEPTAALDAIAERALYESYAGLCRGKSSVFVSHRLASTAFCDRVLLMHEGRIAEEGSHQALLAQGGRYARMYEVQARNYRARREGQA